jgi:hypothetical protein
MAHWARQLPWSWEPLKSLNTLGLHAGHSTTLMCRLVGMRLVEDNERNVLNAFNDEQPYGRRRAGHRGEQW